jgi:FkbM family methyltransferase
VLPYQVAERIPNKIIWALRRFFPPIPIPVALPHRICWMATYPHGFDVWVVNIEKGERRFVAQSLRAGMTVLDLGAHHGLYTTLMSRLVGPSGKVVAFEPSPRERRGLERHLRLNGCNNVTVVPMAVSSSAGASEFFLVENVRSGASSLRRTSLNGGFPRSERIPVQVTALDPYLRDNGIDRVDFMKMDIEGAELEAFRGAKRLLTSERRPTLVVEMADQVSKSWGYLCREKYDLLTSWGYEWYAIQPDGSLTPSPRQEHYEGFSNLVAKPKTGP